jgi:hypothetical protein
MHHDVQLPDWCPYQKPSDYETGVATAAILPSVPSIVIQVLVDLCFSFVA